MSVTCTHCQKFFEKQGSLNSHKAHCPVPTRTITEESRRKFAWNRGQCKEANPRVRGKEPLSDDVVFTANSDHERVAKRRFASETPNACMSCGTPNFWNGKPLRLQIDHVNGNKRDNRRENFRKLCPNCHCQTETWGRRKRV